MTVEIKTISICYHVINPEHVCINVCKSKEYDIVVCTDE